MAMRPSPSPGAFSLLLRGDLRAFLRHADLALAALVVLVVAMMIVPLPTFVLDVAICLNIAVSVTLLLVALYVADALEIATFPTLLLLTTLFRLALEVSATRLILLKANAGEVIHAFGNFVVAGNLVVGAVVFAILTFIQLVVISRGAERVAEVGARFALDALPGKQMAIDAELRGGHIDQAEARRRRASLARESQFFGAMDGAMKFVKGDALAGIVVLLTNIVGGLVIGIVQRGMDAGAAVRTYTLLTIGQGLVAQIPALVISTAAGLLVTRVAAEEEGAPGQLGREVGRQILAQPKALGVAAALMAALALVPGLPAAPFLLLAALFGFVAFRLVKTPPRAEAGPALAAPALAPVVIELDPAAHEALRALLPAAGQRIFAETGIPLPPVALEAAAPGAPAVIRLSEVPVARLEPWAGAPELADRLVEVLGRLGHELFGIQETQGLLDALERTHPALVREVVPKIVSPVLLAEVLGRLAEEGISLRALPEVLGTLAEAAPREKDPGALTEQVRAALRRQITHKHASGGTLQAYSLDPMIEDAVREAIQRRDGTTHLALEPALARDIVQAVGRAVRVDPEHAVVVTAADVRPHLRRLLEAEHPRVAVLSYRELAPETKLEPRGRITVAG
jgi:type III secretion protein V